MSHNQKQRQQQRRPARKPPQPPSGTLTLRPEELTIRPEARDLRWVWCSLQHTRDVVHKAVVDYLGFPPRPDIDPRDIEQEVYLTILQIPVETLNELRGGSDRFLQYLASIVARGYFDREFRSKFINCHGRSFISLTHEVEGQLKRMRNEWEAGRREDDSIY